MVLDLLVQARRNKAAAVHLLHKLVHTLGFAPEAITTGTLLSRSALRRLRAEAEAAWATAAAAA